jgi:uncharacterized membrane protein
MDPPEARSGALPGVVLGLGLGGFVDGIVLHQLLQWHHMVSSVDRYPTKTIDGLEANTLVDGVFHAAMFVLVAAGVALLWRDARNGLRFSADRLFLGCLIVGWGLFNVLDEVVNHALLDLHHIREGENELVYDMAFLAFGVVQLLVGSLLVRSGRNRLRESVGRAVSGPSN